MLSPTFDGSAGFDLQSNEFDVDKQTTSQLRPSQMDQSVLTKRRPSHVQAQHLSPIRLQIKMSREKERKMQEQSKRDLRLTIHRDRQLSQMLGPLIKKKRSSLGGASLLSPSRILTSPVRERSPFVTIGGS